MTVPTNFQVWSFGFRTSFYNETHNVVAQFPNCHSLAQGAIVNRALLAGTIVALVLAACTNANPVSFVPSPTASPSPVEPQTLSSPHLPTLLPTVWNPTYRIRTSQDCLKAAVTGYQASDGLPPMVVGEIRNECPFGFSNLRVDVILERSLTDTQVSTVSFLACALGLGRSTGFGATWTGSSGQSLTARDGAWDRILVGVQGIGIGVNDDPVSQMASRIDVSDPVTITNHMSKDFTIMKVCKTGYSAEGRVVAWGGYLFFIRQEPIQFRSGESVEFRFTRGASFGSFDQYTEVNESKSWSIGVQVSSNP